MAASIVTGVSANSSVFTRQLEAAQRKRVTSHPMRPVGFYPFESTTAIATTSLDDVNDEVYLVKFPENCYLLGSSLVVTATDMDTNATPTLVFDINIDTGLSESTMVNNSTIGQAGGTDYSEATGIPEGLIDVGGDYLGMKVVTAAATGAAGTITVQGIVYVGSFLAIE